VIGLAWKVLIADQLSPTASAVFDNNLEVGLIEAWIGLWAYTLQIYFDFGGYSNMAIGLGLILGFPFPRNFRTPYASLSVTEFWRRWHISLSSWFRDYMYIPMGGSRLSASRTYFNLLSVFFFCGLWHGASWTFVVWGLYHGFFLIAERAWLLRILDAAPHTFRMMYTLLVIMGGWVLFRATDLDSALVLYAGLAGMNGVTGLSIDTLQTLTPLALMVFMVGLYLSIAGDHAKLRLKSKRLEATVDAVLIGSLTLLCSISVGADTFSPFLYFRF
jgi:D-alanyl-lipoteichoic acid acyltransferase DltB (MBOAT superfamily)